jgi:hypothetical protein
MHMHSYRQVPKYLHIILSGIDNTQAINHNGEWLLINCLRCEINDGKLGNIPHAYRSKEALLSPYTFHCKLKVPGLLSGTNNMPTSKH